MTPLDTARTVRRRNLRNGRQEIWGAHSADGQWAYERGEESGTPWHIHHVPTSRCIEYAAGSLKSARLATASGWATRQLDRRATTTTGATR